MAVYKLQNTIQHYAWGSKKLIPELLKIGNPENKPFAEIWMGGHPKAPSIIPELHTDLLSYMENNFKGAHGQKYRLPYLFKVLAAGSPLSIQAHPDKEQAITGFKRENAQNIPLNSPERNYKDPNHKPELICAQTEFWALRGFRDPEITVSFLSECNSEECGFLKRELINGGFKRFLASLLGMESERKQLLCSRIKRETLHRNELHWEWVHKLLDIFPHDPGALGPLFLNIIRLSPGEAMFLPAGELHSYLYGMGIELMANSDNVLRGGLTEKHIDTQELLKILQFSQDPPRILTPQFRDEHIGTYDTSADEFKLSVIKSRKPELPVEISDPGVSICINMGKTITVVGGTGENLIIGQGESFLSDENTKTFSIAASDSDNSVLYRAGIPS